MRKKLQREKLSRKIGYKRREDIKEDWRKGKGVIYRSDFVWRRLKEGLKRREFIYMRKREKRII